MSKRKNPPILENKELSISKAKKSLRKKTQLTGENNLETRVQTSEASNSSPKATVLEATQECEGTILNRGGKLVPVFTKQKKPLTERNFGETATIWTEQAQRMDGNVLDTTNDVAQNAVVSSESLEPMDLFVAKAEDAENQVILHCEEVSERLDVKTQEQESIRRVNDDDDDASSGFVDARQGTGAEPNLQASICEKEMPKEQVSFSLYTPDNEDVDGLEKRPFSVKSLNGPLVKEMDISLLEEDRIADHTISIQNEEVHLSSLDMGMEQNKAIQDVIKLADIEEENWTENGSRKGEGLIQCIVSQPQEENSITQLSLVKNLSVSTCGEQSNHPCIYSVVKQGSTDAKEGKQSHPSVNGKTEGRNDICSSPEPGVTHCKSTISEKATDQHNLWISEELLEQSGRGRISVQSSCCRRETFVAEQNSVKGQDISGKVLPDNQSGCIYLGKEANLSESKCEQVIVRSNLLFPQPDWNVQSENRKTSVQDVVCSEEKGRERKEIGMKVSLAESTTDSPDLEVPVLLTQQQQKENSCENLMSNTKQPEFDRFDLRPIEIVETLSNRGVGQQTLAKIPKSETKEKLTENSLVSTDAHLDGKKEMFMCVENKNKPVHVESGLSSVEVLPTLRGMGELSREHNADADTQRTLLASRTHSSMTVPSSFDARAQTCSPCADPLSMDLEFLPDSQLQGIFESHSRELSPHKSAFLDNPRTCTTDKSDQCAAGGGNGTQTLPPVLTHQNNARDEAMERICNPSKQEDATDVVCGLIKELSNLNRLIMSTHRDLDSFKRMKFRRNRQPGKLLPHSMNSMTSTRCTVKRKREL